jgi:magnesium transporter
VARVETPDQPPLRIAGEQATGRVPVAAPSESAESVLAAMVGASFECADDVAVLDNRRLVGVVPIERLLAAEPGTRMSDLMDADPPVVTPDADGERVAWETVRRNESSVAVVDGSGDFHGLVPPHRLLSALLTEHDEDVARLGGYMASTQRARQAAEEPVGRRLWHRLPWLLVGLAGAVLSAAIVGAYEQQLEEEVLLAFFLPGVVYMSAAIGTQTQTVLIRGFSVGASTGQVFRRELASGLLLSLVIAVAFLPIAFVGWGDGGVALGVALALLASSAGATLVAMALPWVFQRIGLDPAFGSGPLATVIQDILTIAIYFAVAAPVAAG